ncbi:aldose 1-epimerase [Niveispirillum sp. KHB5.9]|uniref:aldose 1-epimerase n=1 Tax=Niveispirillum sp. KHB5.9 TaxID=3400269 RepID=UPI003A8A83FD
MTSTITLSAGPIRAEVAPAIGGALLSLTRDGVPILRPTPEGATVRQTACYPMLPYANRIADGRFLFAMRWHQLRRNTPDIAHPLHGLGWQREWDVEVLGGDHVTLRLSHKAVDEGEWPYAFTARMEYRLTDAGLEIGLQLTNDSPGMAPAGMGLHPFFPRGAGTMLRFSALSYWRSGADGLPERVVMPPDPDFRHGRMLDDGLVDGDFPGWAGIAHVTGSAPGLLVSLRADRLFGTLRVYTPAGRDFFAVEPVTHGANALNQPELPAMAILAPGTSLSGTVRILAEPLA